MTAARPLTEQGATVTTAQTQALHEATALLAFLRASLIHANPEHLSLEGNEIEGLGMTLDQLEALIHTALPEDNA